MTTGRYAVEAGRLITIAGEPGFYIARMSIAPDSRGPGLSPVDASAMALRIAGLLNAAEAPQSPAERVRSALRRLIAWDDLHGGHADGEAYAGVWAEAREAAEAPPAPEYRETVAQALATSLDALRHCEAEPADSVNYAHRMGWAERWRERIEWLCREFLPSGSGIDCGITLDADSSKPDRLRLIAPFHHMDSHGSYSGWSEYRLTVRPSLIHGMTVDIAGRDANGTRDHVAETVRDALAASHPHAELYPAHWSDKPAAPAPQGEA